MDFFEKSIIELQNQRPIFHSEDDLKLALAFNIKKNNPEFEIRLERPVQLEMINRNGKGIAVRAPIDIIVMDTSGDSYPIELKYKTRKANILHNNENYILAEHGAQDAGRYSFRKDIYRIENYKSSNLNYKYGYVLILTNDNAYFEKNVFKKDNIDKHFSFHNGVILNRSDLSWNYSKLDKSRFIFNENKVWCNIKSKEHWTCSKENFYKLDLLKDYEITWKDFSVIEKTTFKYCLIKIG
ncbi:hypothetical protein D0817_06635 [Flavobacterium cupreum]|uniref:Uncharacterized protein n=2 Tax=Flavobacterium TaxID=237 RepID=A0A4Y7UEL5_9FLAO|nr:MULTISPECIES: hypothetical protein [Flavobacterium]RUT71546.1 hypothetical protein D0817_06635 [Flavobacterium cupreum]TCN59617.1 hypothetical protein EV142_102235 [Flavobacterium circumlabens]TEB44895.1 hypothetical protein D0809_06835 [Flavobacterium circumlabens]